MRRVSDEDRTARLELRVSPTEKRLLQRAAMLGGEDVSALTRRAALIEARRVVARAGEAKEAGEGARTRGAGRRKGRGAR